MPSDPTSFSGFVFHDTVSVYLLYCHLFNAGSNLRLYFTRLLSLILMCTFIARAQRSKFLRSLAIYPTPQCKGTTKLLSAFLAFVSDLCCRIFSEYHSWVCLETPHCLLKFHHDAPQLCMLSLSSFILDLRYARQIPSLILRAQKIACAHQAWLLTFQIF